MLSGVTKWQVPCNPAARATKQLRQERHQHQISSRPHLGDNQSATVVQVREDPTPLENACRLPTTQRLAVRIFGGLPPTYDKRAPNSPRLLLRPCRSKSADAPGEQNFARTAPVVKISGRHSARGDTRRRLQSSRHLFLPPLILMKVSATSSAVTPRTEATDQAVGSGGNSSALMTKPYRACACSVSQASAAATKSSSSEDAPRASKPSSGPAVSAVASSNFPRDAARKQPSGAPVAACLARPVAPFTSTSGIQSKSQEAIARASASNASGKRLPPAESAASWSSVTMPETTPSLSRDTPRVSTMLRVPQKSFMTSCFAMPSRPGNPRKSSQSS
mmetsp:Transcript_140776/g.449077  ORF Transcript_140776/g.449077 Transcript_140776/m.449077 type:complete len:334 (+) Transcript_140776:157-1158(+)